MATNFEFQEIFQITKMDPLQGKFWATAALGGVKDRAGERLNYLKSKPNFEAIVKSQSAATGGVSKFPLRLQHDDKFCAGRIDDMKFDDARQSVDVEGTVVHPIAKMLLAEKCLTGVSIGGSCTKSRLPDGTVEYVAIPQEISVVDRPCLEQATFQLVKADGSFEMTKFNSNETSHSLIETLLKQAAQPTMSAETEQALLSKIEAMQKSVDTFFEMAQAAAESCLCKMCETCCKRDFSDEERKKAAESGEALPDGSYPIKTVGDLENAIDAFGRAKDPAKVKAHIIARAKALGATAKLPDSWGVSQKSDFQSPKSEVTMNKEFKDFTPEELAKAHKSAMDHLGLAKAAHAAHVAEMHKAHDAAHTEICGHLDNCAKAMGVDTVPMSQTKTVTTDGMKKEDAPSKTQDQIITETVTAVLNKALGIEPPKEETLEEKVQKAVSAVLEPILAKTAPGAARPTFNKPATEEKLTDDQRAELAKRAALGDREAIDKMFKSTSAGQMSQAGRA
jgi:hypothetical protein